jgi:outer membrane translocation and assembly module TamA
MRGIYAERLQDRCAVVGQVEYRYPIWRKFSGVAFASVGEVAHRVDGFTLSGARYAAGGGLRFALNVEEKLNVRFDVGVGEWGAETYFQFQEAF